MDAVLLYFSLLIALFIRHSFDVINAVHSFELLFFHFAPLYALWLGVAYLFDFYEVPPLRKNIDLLARTLLYVVLATLIGMVYFYSQPSRGISPRTILFLNAFISGGLLFFWHVLLGRAKIFERFIPRIIIVGYHPELDTVISLIGRDRLKVSALFVQDSPSEDVVMFCQKYDIKLWTAIDTLRSFIEKEHIGTAVFTAEYLNDHVFMRRMLGCMPPGVRFMRFDVFYELHFLKIPMRSINEIWFLEHIYRSENRMYLAGKRAVDGIVGFIGLCMFGILFFPIALWIYLDSPGPILYRQQRSGKDGKPFTLAKFRTMGVNSEKDGPQLASQTDPRITGVGRFLRSTHLDELPQFMSVLRGDLSLVGPRPERPEFNAIFHEMIPFHQMRLMVQPGLTGWAQVYYHAPENVFEARERLMFDFFYMKNRSLLLDLRIVLKTLQMIALRKKFH